MDKIRLKYLLISLLMLTISLFFNCSYPGRWKSFSPEITHILENSPVQEDYPDAAAVVIQDEGMVEIVGSDRLASSVLQKKRIVKILQARGQSYANIVIPYSEKSRVRSIRARTISPDGTVTELEKDRIFDRSLYPGYIFFSDQKAKIFALPAVEPGAVIEYEYTIHIQSQSLWHAWYFQDDVPILHSRFTLIAPSESPIQWKMFGDDIKPEIEKAPSGFKSTYVWEQRDIPPVLEEAGRPPYWESGIWLAITPVWTKTWDQVTGWVHTLWEPQLKSGEGVKKLAEKLTKDEATETGKLKNIFTWVRDHIRYIAIQIGNGGYQPHPVDEILINRYGDCKDMTALVCALAKEAGIDAYPLLISTRQNGFPDTTLISHSHFNHVIAYAPSVGGNHVFMDCTEKGCAFGNIPWYDQGMPALMIGKEGKALLLTTPENPPNENHQAIIWRIGLDSTGAAVGRGQTNRKGAYADELRETIMQSSQDEIRNWLECHLIDRCSGARLESFEIDGMHPVRDPLTISYEFWTPAFSLPVSNEMVLQPEQWISFRLPDEFTREKRRYPVRFKFGSKDEVVTIVKLPDGWKLKTPIFSDSLITPYGTATWELIDYGKHIRYKTTLELTGEDILPDVYPEFQKFMTRIRDIYRQKRICIVNK